jgi:hypothetical protein
MSPVVATGDNQLEIGRAWKPLNQARSVAVCCHQLLRAAHGRRGSTVRVRQRASRKDLQIDRYFAAHFPFGSTAEDLGTGLGDRSGPSSADVTVLRRSVVARYLVSPLRRRSPDGEPHSVQVNPSFGATRGMTSLRRGRPLQNRARRSTRISS